MCPKPMFPILSTYVAYRPMYNIIKRNSDISWLYIMFAIEKYNKLDGIDVCDLLRLAKLC